MQLNKLGPVAGLLLTAVLSACGGGGGDEAPPVAAAPAPSPVLVSAANSTALRAIVNTQVQFDGGACSGGTPPYAPAAWDYGDGTGTTNTHTYTVPGTYSVVVTCTDSKNVSKQSTFSIDVLSAAYAGFLGRTWSTYAKIDPAYGYTYPAVGIAETSGDIYGMWLRSNVDSYGHYSHTTDVVASSSNFSATQWTMATPDPQVGTLGAMPTFDGTGFNPITAAIDMAVSPNGKAIAAWRTVSSTTGNSSLWVATKNGSDSWSTPALVNVLVGAEVAAPTSVNDASIKVVVNDHGDGAIAYCTGATATARIVVYSNTNQTTTTPVDISKRCDTAVSFSETQKTRSFDIAIDNASTVTAVGLIDSATAGNFFISQMSIPLVGATTSINVSNELTPAKMPSSDFSLYYATSPNGARAAVAWTEVGTPVAPYPQTNKTTVSLRLYSGGSWSAAPASISLTTFEYIRPMIALNDAGQVFIVMETDTPPSGAPYFNRAYRTIVGNYAASTGPSVVVTDTDTTPAADYRLNATDIAIDQWGTGLITRSTGYQTQAGTLSPSGVWSGFKPITPSYYSFHYQTMRALPDGRAILATSIKSTTGNLSSGYVLLK